MASRTDSNPGGFTDSERAAMKERAAELRAAKRGKKNPEEDLLAKIAELPDEDRLLAERLHALIMATAPELAPKTWYGMPAYAADGKIICFLQPATKFSSRYATFGFNDPAQLDDGVMWPTAYALTSWTPEVETEIAALVRKAVSTG